MKIYESKFFHSGEDQKRADTFVKFTRPDDKLIQQWSEQEKREAFNHLQQLRLKFDIWANNYEDKLLK